MGMHFATLFESVCDHKANSTAIVQGDRMLSYREFENRAARLTAHLQSVGLKPGASIGLMMRNSNHYLESVFAAFKLRGTPININYRYKLDELCYILTNSDAEALIMDSAYEEFVPLLRTKVPALKTIVVVQGSQEKAIHHALNYEQVLVAYDPAPPIDRFFEDTYLIYTGGTTGYPKGVRYRNGDYLRQITAIMNQYGIDSPETPADVPSFLDAIAENNAIPVVLPASPMMHQTGMSFGGLMPLSTGGTSVLLEGDSFDAIELLQTAQKHDVTSISIVGDAFAVPILDELISANAEGRPWLLPRLRSMVSSGAMWSYEVRKELLKYLNIVLADNIASTEGNMGLAVSSRDRVLETGIFTPAANVAVVDDDLHPLDPGSVQIGRIAIKNSLPLGYFNDADKSAEVFVEALGTRATIPGDCAQLLANGDIRLLGRGTNCINSGGEKIYPEEVEELLKTHPAITDALVIGVVDQRFGQKVAAVISAKDISVDEIVDFSRDRMAGFKVPRKIVLVEKIGRFASGKPDYNWAHSILDPDE